QEDQLESVHETGHMLGMGDLYNTLGENGADNKSAPPPPGKDVPSNATDQYLLVREFFGGDKPLADAFAVPAGLDTDLMSAGGDVRKYDYVTLREALGAVTEPTIHRTDWDLAAAAATPDSEP